MLRYEMKLKHQKTNITLHHINTKKTINMLHVFQIIFLALKFGEIKRKIKTAEILLVFKRLRSLV